MLRSVSVPIEASPVAVPASTGSSSPAEVAGQASGPVRTIINNAELRVNAQSIFSLIREARPKNTISAYEPKQEEFRRFCWQKEYLDGDTVTEEKLLFFLVEDVVNRPLRSHSQRANSDAPLAETRLAWQSV